MPFDFLWIYRTRTDRGQLPPDLLIPSSLLPMGDGTVDVPVVNVGKEDRWIRPRTILGQLHMIEAYDRGMFC